MRLTDGIRDFARRFRSRRGPDILAGQMAMRTASFALSVLLIRVLDQETYGALVYALTLVSFALPFAGAGIAQGLVRFAARTDGFRHTLSWSRRALRTGLVVSLALVVVLWLTAPWLTARLPAARPFLLVFGVMLVTWFVADIARSALRSVHLNRLTGRMDMAIAASLVVVGVALLLLHGPLAYAIAYTVIPAVVAGPVLWRLLRHAESGHDLTDWVEGRRQGLYMGLGNILAQLLLYADILMIGNLLAADDVAVYKAASLIPFSLVLLPNAVLTTDYVTLARSSHDGPAIRAYLGRYLRTFIPLAVVLAAALWLMRRPVLGLFGPAYADADGLFALFLVGMTGILVLRTLMGNLLMAFGYARANFVLSTAMIAVNLGLNWVLIHAMGLAGAAIATCSIIWLYGLVAGGVIWRHVQRTSRGEDGADA